MDTLEQNRIGSYTGMVEALRLGARVYHYSNYWNQTDEVLSVDTSTDSMNPTVLVLGNTGNRTHCTNMFGKGDKNWFEFK